VAPESGTRRHHLNPSVFGHRRALLFAPGCVLSFVCLIPAVGVLVQGLPARLGLNKH
jgi:hypothetical protein